MDSMAMDQVLSFKDNHNVSLETHVKRSGKVLMLFVRHSGCTYCRETLDSFSAFLEQERDNLKEGLNFKPVVVHMSSYKAGEELLERYGLGEESHISDPDKKLYKMFNLPQGTIKQLFGLKALWKGVLSLPKYGIGALDGDGLQMPGVFLIDGESILKSFFYKSVADRVDFSSFVSA